jgi:hypothetical protein
VADGNSSWNVLPSGPIERLEENLWRVEGSLPSGPLKRVMTVVRLSDGRLVIHNGISLPEAGMAELEAWRKPSFLVVPNGYHRIDAAAYKSRYPELTVLCPTAARKRVQKVVPVDGDYESFAQQPELRMEHLRGTGDGEGVLIVRSEGGVSLVLNDIVFNMPHSSGVSGVMLRYVTASSGGPRISRVAKMFFIKDAEALRAHLERLAELPNLKRVIVSHHEVIDRDPKRALDQVAAVL